MDKKGKTYETVDAYIRSYPVDVGRKLKEIRACINKTVPDAGEKISYRMPAYFLNGNVVYFGGFKNHIGFFPGPDAIVEFKDDLSTYRTSKGTIQFLLDRPLPLGLIGRIVKYRIMGIGKIKRN